MARQIALAVLGAALIAVAVVVWKYATGTMTSLVENTWCSAIAKSAACQFRGYQHFLVWSAIGIANLLILGLLLERLSDRFRS